MKKTLELQVLKMINSLLPKTTERNNTELKSLLAQIERELTAK